MGGSSQARRIMDQTTLGSKGSDPSGTHRAYTCRAAQMTSPGGSGDVHGGLAPIRTILVGYSLEDPRTVYRTGKSTMGILIKAPTRRRESNFAPVDVQGGSGDT